MRAIGWRVSTGARHEAGLGLSGMERACLISYRLRGEASNLSSTRTFPRSLCRTRFRHVSPCPASGSTVIVCAIRRVSDV